MKVMGFERERERIKKMRGSFWRKGGEKKKRKKK
jgi:hypothetical protein